MLERIRRGYGARGEQQIAGDDGGVDMMRRLLAVLLLVMVTLPALRAGATPTDAGALLGTMRVGSASCGASGSGLSIFTMGTGAYGIEADVIMGLTGSAELLVCGDIGPSLAGLGASCIVSQGSNGTGTLANPLWAVPLSNVGWTLGAGGTLWMTGTAGAAGTLVAVVQAYGGVNCLVDATEFPLVGAATLVGETSPGPGPTPPPAPCRRQGAEVDRYDFTVGAAYTEVAVYQTATDVETCLLVRNGNSPVIERSVVVPTQLPPPPVAVDPDAPAGDQAGTPCDVQHFEGGNSGTRGYVRTSTTGGSGPEYVCVGVRSGGSERHVRVTIG